MAKFTIPTPDVEWRLRIDEDGDVRLEARNPGGEWTGVIYIESETGDLQRFIGVDVAGIHLEPGTTRIASKTSPTSDPFPCP